MEQSTIQWLGAPSCLRGSFAFYKSVGCKSEQGAPPRVWRLGEFYFVRCGPQEPVCVAEVTLLWEDQTRRHLLASSRLYFLPEDTPKGRTGDHGEDEVVAVSKKIVVRVEDLVKWTCPEPPHWKGGCQKSNGLHKSDGLSTGTEPLETKSEGKYGAHVEQQRVRVLSYPQYCRFRSLQKRVQDQDGYLGLQDPHLLALGGLKVAQPNTRILYCRDTFNHPTLYNNASVLTQLGCSSLSLKGRPRKRRGRDSKGLEQPSFNQSESWMEKMKENVMGSVEMRWEGGWLPHPEEQLFLDQLFAFMERRGSPISKVPNLGFKKIDLFLMYSVVKRLGGYERVTSQRLWKTVYNELGGNPGSTSAATCTRRHYEKLMLPYEQHLKGGSPELTKPKASTGNTIVRKPGRGKGEESAVKNSKVTEQATTSDVVVVRKRGRPPGKRNAKLLAKASVGRPPSLRAKRDFNQVEKSHSEPSTPHPSTVFQELKHNNIPLTSGLSSVSSPPIPHPPQQEQGRQTEQVEAQTPSLMVPPSQNQAGGSLGGFSPTKGLCPLDLFRTRLGLSGVVESPGITPQDPATFLQTLLFSQPKTYSPETPESFKHQCMGCRAEDSTQLCQTSRPPLPPLRILPLDIDCSLQVRQLMRTRLGSTHMSSFTKRLSEVLAQDIGKTCPPDGLPLPVPPEQAVPLNLSKRATVKRPADDTKLREALPYQPHGDTASVRAKRLKLEPEDLSLPQKRNGCLYGFPATQDQPADLSSPCRARAFLPDQTEQGLTIFPRSNLIPSSDSQTSSIHGASHGLPVAHAPHVPKQDVENSDANAVMLKPEDASPCRTEPERPQVSQISEPSPSSDVTDQPVAFDDVKPKSDVVPSLKELPSSLLSQPSQSC
ncbi:AT-rich interactive domain-containing protein 5B [Chanos chanos]|uniref:AT-rich interactive domain-containing protein 5B n=1 Tax=Chanos chanos TaxID=29144 RepID=A0A6J2WZM5_CHACN|nr:AT-rich interactive domain-containing protein 5B-like [Chanos chanos]